MPKTTCSINGCEKISWSRGWCSTHYARWRKHGDPLTVLPHPRARERGTPAEEARLIRDGILRRTYGISHDEYDALVEDQGGACALCGESPKRRRMTKRGIPWAGLAVDHDHETGRVRGLLCLGCNVAMGRVDKVGLDTIATYLTYAQDPTVETVPAEPPDAHSDETSCRTPPE